MLVGVNPDECKILLDGTLKAIVEFTQESIIKSNEKKTVIAMASVVAKVKRDAYMVELLEKFPDFGFGIHKGYGTARYSAAIMSHRISSVHRAIFRKNINKEC